MPYQEYDRAALELFEGVRGLIAQWETTDDLASDIAHKIVALARDKLLNEPLGDCGRVIGHGD
jgi:hypothetical protein